MMHTKSAGCPHERRKAESQQTRQTRHKTYLKLVSGRRRIAFFLGAFRELANASETARVGLQTLQALIDGTRIETLVKARAIFSGRSSDDQSRTLEHPTSRQ
jgi:hypothetical protein